MAIVLRGDVLLMQNWEVVTDVLGMLNRMPEKVRACARSAPRGPSFGSRPAPGLGLLDPLRLMRTSAQTREIDFSRVRELNLNGWAKYARQTVFTASHVDPEVVSGFASHCRNYRVRAVRGGGAPARAPAPTLTRPSRGLHPALRAVCWRWSAPQQAPSST